MTLHTRTGHQKSPLEKRREKLRSDELLKKLRSGSCSKNFSKTYQNPPENYAGSRKKLPILQMPLHLFFATLCEVFGEFSDACSPLLGCFPGLLERWVSVKPFLGARSPPPRDAGQALGTFSSTCTRQMRSRRVESRLSDNSVGLHLQQWSR